MPVSPPRPCGKCGQLIRYPATRCQPCTRKQRAATDEKKGEGRQFYGTTEWRKVRAKRLQLDPWCSCGCWEKANTVDHILSRRERPDLALSLSNTRSFYENCHNRHTATYGGGWGRKPKDEPMPMANPKPCDVPGCGRLAHPPQRSCAFHLDERRAFLLPVLEPSAIPLTIVCGPPGSGKTRYVEQHAQQGDTIIDLDYIKARLSGQPIYHVAPSWFERAMWERNRMLAQLAHTHAGRAWFIAGAPTPEERDHWANHLKPESIIVLTVPVAKCMQRIANDTRRPNQAQRFERVVRDWWRDYEPRAGDITTQG